MERGAILGVRPVLVVAVEALVVLGQQVQMVKLLHLTMAVMEEIQRYKVHHGQVELMVIR